MSKRRLNILLGIIALIFGSLLYILFRENTYIAKAFGSFDIIVQMREILSPYATNFLMFYFPDFLWAFSFCCGLCAIFTPRISGTIICGCMVLFIGCGWEGMQYWKIIGGTGDVLDIIAYLLAGIANIIINLKEREK